MTIARSRWKLGKALCAYCGTAVATTRDHPVPENLYPVELRARLQMLVVPSCRPCNDAKSRVDGTLRDFLLIDMDSSEHPVVRQVFQDKMMTAVSDNHVRLLDGFYKGKNVPVFNQEGNYDGEGFAIPADLEPVSAAVEWLTRGLHWGAFGVNVDLASTDVKLVQRNQRMDTIVQMAVMGWTGSFHQGGPISTGWILAPSGTVYWAHSFFDAVLFLARTRLSTSIQSEEDVVSSS